MEEDKFNFQRIKTADQCKQEAEKAIEYMRKSGNYMKEDAAKYLNAMYNQLTSKQTSPTSKVMVLHILKQLTYLSDVKLFSLVCNHPVYEFMASQAKNIDPRKMIKEKGKQKFVGNPLIGNQYIRLILQLIRFWGEKFAKGKNAQPTKYKKTYNQLKANFVVFPQQYEILLERQFTKARKLKGEVQIKQTKLYRQTIPSLPKLPQKIGKIETEIRLIKSYIDYYLPKLEETQDQFKMKEIIQHYNKLFEQCIVRVNNRDSQLNDQDVQLYSGVVHFLIQQRRIYEKSIPKQKYYQGYITELKLVYENTFEQNKNQPKSTITRSAPINVNNYPSNNNPKSKVQQSQIINNFYKKIQQREKSPGFRSIVTQLEKQKEFMKKSPGRRASRSPRNVNKSAGLNLSSASNLKQSKISPIFSFPPNPHVADKYYQGQAVYQNKQLVRAIYNIKKQQGIRRFKISNFRQKNPLFQNQQIQIGYKSQPVYEDIEGFKNFILLNIYIGNKTYEGVKYFQVEYKGDNNQLLYANPRNVDSIIPAGCQNKHDLMITPTKIPFGFITMEINYKYKNTGYMTSIVLPNSVLKYASYMKISRTQFENNWRNSVKFKTNQFRLCKYLPPDGFNKWIPVLESLTKYAQFSAQGSQTDLQMFCSVILLQKYEAVLKLNIRPNLQVVVQLGVMSNIQEEVEYFKFYLQTLQLVLKEIDI